LTSLSSAKGLEPRAEEALVAAAQDGDRSAFEALVLPCQSGILRWLTRLTKDRPAAEELFQESLFKAYVSLAGFRGESSFATWLSRIARNSYLAWRKALQKRPDNVPMSTGDDELDASLEPADGWSHLPPTPEEQLWQQELAGAIQKSLDALPEPLREAFEQREQGGLSYAEIAQLQQVPVGTVRSRIHRAREAIAQDLKHLMEPV
jgi:RNA polymerase sigma-70 factor (ECF subfamily)